MGMIFFWFGWRFIPPIGELTVSRMLLMSAPPERRHPFSFTGTFDQKDHTKKSNGYKKEGC